MPESHTRKTPAQIFGERLREARERRGWTQGELAEKLHVNRTTLNKIEKGTRADVRISQLFEFAKALDIAPVHLLTPRLGDAGVVLTPGSNPKHARDARSWIRGEAVLGKPDPVAYLLDLPQDEQRVVLEELFSQGNGRLDRLLMADEIEQKTEEILQAIETAEKNRRKENDA